MTYQKVLAHRENPSIITARPVDVIPIMPVMQVTVISSESNVVDILCPEVSRQRILKNPRKPADGS